jgi:hypothetical protein
MTDLDVKAKLHRYLRETREALLGKLDGLSEYDPATARNGTARGGALVGAW